MSHAEAHPLFQRFPLTGTLDFNGVKLPSRYHVYDGIGTLLCGTCDGPALAERFAGQDVHPVLTRSGAGLIGVFICRFDKASHGPHLELQVSALAAPRPGVQIADTPEAFPAAFGTREDLGLLSLDLWNDATDVVAFNTGFLGLDAKLASGQVAQADKRLRFSFADAQGAALLSGDVSWTGRTPAREGLSLMRQMGLGATWRAMRQPWARACLINRKTKVMPENRRATTLTAPDTVEVRRFDSARDRLEMGEGTLRDIGFAPTIYEHLNPFRFVYLHPDDRGDTTA